MDRIRTTPQRGAWSKRKLVGQKVPFNSRRSGRFIAGDRPHLRCCGDANGSDKRCKQDADPKVLKEHVTSHDVANRPVRRVVPIPCLPLDETSLLTRHLPWKGRGERP